MLIVGGIVLLAIDRMPLPPRYTDVMDYPPSLAFKIGLFQCLALIPGVSRSGATIVGAHAHGHRQALGRRVLVLPRHADDGRGLRLRPLQELGGPAAGAESAILRSGSSRPSSPPSSSCATCSTTSAATALRCSAGGGSSSGAWRWGRCSCSGRRATAPPATRPSMAAISGGVRGRHAGERNSQRRGVGRRAQASITEGSRTTREMVASAFK